MSNGRKVAMVIAVADAKPLKYLTGALNGARDFETWARAMGYETHPITDEQNEVTVERLRSEIESALHPQKGSIYRLVLYFAGHGLIREAEEGLWLMSDWYNELRAVASEPLKRRLFAYDVQQISMFADACRDLPNNIATADLTPDAVLGRGPKRVVTLPPVDKFIATQDGASAYMIPGNKPEEDLCLFSGVLMQDLWGVKPTAISTLVPGKVTSSSLGTYLRNEVPEIAKLYQRTANPAVYPLLPDGDDIYFDSAAAPPAPIFQPWPMLPAQALQPLGVRVAGIAPFEAEEATDAPALPSGPRVGQSAEPAARNPQEDTAAETPQLRSLLDRMREQPRPAIFDTGAGIVVEGAPIRTIWSTPQVAAKLQTQSGGWRLSNAQGNWLREPAPLLIEFEDDLFAAIAALPEFIGSILRDRHGVPALIYREIYSEPKDQKGTEQAIAAMESGALRADAVTDLAVQLRQLKHQDPVLGVISAYLYDAIGDVDSIRRMAGYYIQHNQPIPYDIALLAVVPGQWRDGSQLWVHIPPVEARAPRTAAEVEHSWCYSSMPEAQGIVGGCWPWMRQGWAFLEAPIDVETTLIRPGLAELAPRLTRSRFATLDAEGGQRLARLFGLERRG